LIDLFKDARARTGSLIGGGDDHSLYTHQEESLYVDLTLVRLGLLRLNFMMESCPPGSLPDPQFLNSLLILVCCFYLISLSLVFLCKNYLCFFRIHQLSPKQHILLNVLILFVVVH
jgi:hypothetical protein